MGIIDSLNTIFDCYGQYTDGEKLKTKVEKSVELLQKKGLDFDTIAVQGVSGLLIGAPLARDLGKDLLIVRKPGDKTHCLDVMGAGAKQKILIVDDSIETGATLRNIISKIRGYCPNPTFAGVFIYTGIYSYTEWDLTKYIGEKIDVITFPSKIKFTNK